MPDLISIFGSSPVAAKFPDFGSLLSGLLNVAFTLAVFLAFFWLVWGAFQYMAAGGDKNALAEARSRIIWALVGLLITAIAFLVAQWASQILPLSGLKPGRLPIPTI